MELLLPFETPTRGRIFWGDYGEGETLFQIKTVSRDPSDVTEGACYLLPLRGPQTNGVVVSLMSVRAQVILSASRIKIVEAAKTLSIVDDYNKRVFDPVEATTYYLRNVGLEITDLDWYTPDWFERPSGAELDFNDQEFEEEVTRLYG